MIISSFPNYLHAQRLRRMNISVPFLHSLFFLMLTLSNTTTYGGSHIITLDDQKMELDIDSAFSDEQEKVIVNWIDASSNALRTVYNRWPRNTWHIKVSPMSEKSDDPVPWAQVNRGNPDRVSFYIDASASQSKLIGNWTAYHEFSHLLIPYRGWGDMWFSEGLASYYQNIIQARAGVFDEQTMWQKLCDGFVRGKNNKMPNSVLAAVSNDMHKTRSYMRVYWSGALYFLQADLALRQASNGKMSLDYALSQLNKCCANQSLSARQIVSKLDRFSDSDVFSTSFKVMADSKAIPDFTSVFDSLGISIENGKVVLNEKSINPDQHLLRRGFLKPLGNSVLEDSALLSEDL